MIEELAPQVHFAAECQVDARLETMLLSPCSMGTNIHRSTKKHAPATLQQPEQHMLLLWPPALACFTLCTLHGLNYTQGGPPSATLPVSAA